MNSLDGLGVLNTDNASATVQSPKAVEVSASSKRYLAESIGTASTPAEMVTGLCTWAAQFPPLAACPTDVAGQPSVSFTFPDRQYTVLPVISTQDAVNVANTLNGCVTNGVFLALSEFTPDQKKELTAKGFDYICYSDILTIDTASMTMVPYVAVDKRFYSRLSIEISKTCHKGNLDTIKTSVSDWFSSFGRGVKQSFSEGFNQIADSVAITTATLKGSKGVQASTVCIPEQCTADLTKQPMIEMQSIALAEPQIAVETAKITEQQFSTDVPTADLTKRPEQED